MGQIRHLSIYLNDHLAGATVGVELVRRAYASNREEAELAGSLEPIRAEIETDRETLEQVMDRLGVRRSTLKPVGGWLAEKAGRLKPNGQLFGYSPLSRLVELEALCIGIAGKIQLWAALEEALGAEWSGFDFSSLGERAARQRATLEELHRKAAASVFAAEPVAS